MNIQIAYISYVAYQNAPSSPMLGEVQVGRIKEDIERLWRSSFNGDDDDIETAQMRSSDWGDVELSNGDIGLYVTFEDKYRAQAFKELGITPKE